MQCLLRAEKCIWSTVQYVVQARIISLHPVNIIKGDALDGNVLQHVEWVHVFHAIPNGWGIRWISFKCVCFPVVLQIKDKLTALAVGGLHGDVVPEAPPRSRVSSSDWAAVEAGRLTQQNLMITVLVQARNPKFQCVCLLVETYSTNTGNRSQNAAHLIPHRDAHPVNWPCAWTNHFMQTLDASQAEPPTVRNSRSRNDHTLVSNRFRASFFHHVGEALREAPTENGARL